MKNNTGNYTHQVENPDNFIRFDLTEGTCWFKEEMTSWFNKITISDVTHYPDEKITNVKKLLSLWLHIKEDNVAIGSGSDELIEMIPQIFTKPKDKVLTISPSFFRFIESSQRAKTEIVTIKLDEKNDFEWSSSTMQKFLKKAGDKKIALIWLASPNNPTGVDVPHPFLLELIKLGKTIVIDKVLNGFTNELRELSQLVCEYPNIIVLSSFSKTFGLPGLRFGFTISAKENTNLLEKRRLPFNIAGPSLSLIEKLLQSLLGGGINMKGAFSFFQEKAYVERQIKKLNHIRIASRSNTNFILLQSIGRFNLFKKLLKKGILVTNLNHTMGIKKKNLFRVTIRDRQSNQILLKALREINNGFIN